MANVTACHTQLYDVDGAAPSVDYELVYQSNLTLSMTNFLLMLLLILAKIFGHLSVSVILDPSKGAILASISWFLSQCIISWINHLPMRWSYFILLNLLTCIILSSLVSKIQSKHKLVVTVAAMELFWLFTSNDISILCLYIFVFEGCFVQRIVNEYMECKWNDRHLLVFLFSKIVFISWIFVSSSWIISFFETLYFIIPYLSLKYKPCKITFDQWFLMDGCSHLSLFCFWWFSFTQ